MSSEGQFFIIILLLISLVVIVLFYLHVVRQNETIKEQARYIKSLRRLANSSHELLKTYKGKEKSNE